MQSKIFSRYKQYTCRLLRYKGQLREDKIGHASGPKYCRKFANLQDVANAVSQIFMQNDLIGALKQLHCRFDEIECQIGAYENVVKSLLFKEGGIIEDESSEDFFNLANKVLEAHPNDIKQINFDRYEACRKPRTTTAIPTTPSIARKAINPKKNGIATTKTAIVSTVSNNMEQSEEEEKTTKKEATSTEIIPRRRQRPSKPTKDSIRSNKPTAAPILCQNQTVCYFLQFYEMFKFVSAIISGE